MSNIEFKDEGLRKKDSLRKLIQKLNIDPRTKVTVTYLGLDFANTESPITTLLVSADGKLFIKSDNIYGCRDICAVLP